MNRNQDKMRWTVLVAATACATTVMWITACTSSSPNPSSSHRSSTSTAPANGPAGDRTRAADDYSSHLPSSGQQIDNVSKSLPASPEQLAFERKYEREHETRDGVAYVRPDNTGAFEFGDAVKLSEGAKLNQDGGRTNFGVDANLRRGGGPPAGFDREHDDAPTQQELAELARMYTSRCPTPRGEGKGLRFASNEEVWVIQRCPEHVAQPDEMNPGTGSMGCFQNNVLVPVPLKHTDVHATITGFIGSVDVQQTFTNPYNVKIEAVYAFPLPENAAVNEFVMTIGDRHIRGIIRDKNEAQQIYAQARAEGHVASILNQERPNLFVQKVANIEPGKEIDISIKYYNTLAYSDGAYEFVFPMVVAPRYNPSGSAGIGAVPRGQARTSGQATEVSYLRPNERSGTDIAIKVDVDTGVSMERIESLNHDVHVNRHGDHEAQVELSRNDSIPNKDFVLRCYVAGDKVKSTVLTTRDEKGGGVFALMMVPPRDLKKVARGPLEMVYVLDASGSMNGRPIEQAKSAIERSLKHLNADDTFQLINFANSSSQFGPRPIPATPENINRAIRHLDEIQSAGGTEMMNGIRASLDFPHDPGRMRYVTFLTDGLIGNESDIIREIHGRLGNSRIFSFGVSTAPNRYLLDAMARVGSGGAAYLAPEDSSAEVMDAFDERISHPALYDVALDFGNATVSDVFPSRIPDLFVDRPVIVTGHFRGNAPTNVQITGRAGGSRMTTNIARIVEAERGEAKALPRIWANMKIQSLAEQALWKGGLELVPEAKATALRYAIMSPFTSFVAVDSMSHTQGTYGTTVQVPVAVPDGTNYDTTVGK